MKTKIITLVLLAFIGLSNIHAQVGIGTTTPNASAALDLTATDKGFLPPRMTTLQRDAIASPATGLVIYNNDDNCLQWFDGAFWFNACDGTLSTGGDPSSGGSAVVSAWTSTIGCSVGAGPDNSPAGVRQAGVNETMVQGVAAPAGATVTLVANVTTAGTYAVITDEINGVQYAATGTFAGTGNQTVTLNPIGTPTSAGNFMWTAQVTPSIDVYGSVITTQAPLGSTYTNHFNGISGGVSTDFTLATYTTGETFDQNATCANEPISAQGCGGVTTVTAGGVTYNTVEINGQCWLETNLNHAPSQADYAAYTATDWTNTSPGDQGYWGYYNTSTTNGSAGWGTTEPAANEGLLYQWCGAMDATISERSKGICPDGFHIPSDCEWMYLEHGQGMAISEQNGSNWRSNTTDNQGTPGYKLRSQGTGQTNASGFSGLLAGYRSPNGTFFARPSYGGWWSSSAPGATPARARALQTGFRGVTRGSNTEAVGFSVRCLKD